MKTNDVFPSKYLKAEDFEDGEIKMFTIRNVELQELGQGQTKETKPVMTFREPDSKALVVNKTNWSIIAQAYGDESDDWLGKRVALHVMEVQSFGDIVRAIRVKSKQQVALPKVVSPVAADDEGELFDEPEPCPTCRICHRAT